jgi:hypothetical protein
MKLRINKDLHQRAHACAEAIDESLKEFLRVALIFHSKGKLKDVALCDNGQSATLKTVPVEFENMTFDPTIAREALAGAVAWAESRNPPPFTPDKSERNFIIAEGE